MPKPPAIPRVSIQDLIDTSMHNIVHDSTTNRLTCLTCKSSRPYKSVATKSWLSAPCESAFPQLADIRPSPFPMQLQVANQVTHPSHTLFNMRGVIFCMKCGSMSGGTSIKGLVKPCLRPEGEGRAGKGSSRGAHGQRVLQALARGEMPEPIRRNFGGWPDEITQARF